MLMPQGDRQQHLWQGDHRERRDPAHFAALAPQKRIERVNQLPLDLRQWHVLWGRWREHQVRVARTGAHGS